MTSSTPFELLPCPMCGSDARVEGLKYFWVICSNEECMLQNRGSTSREKVQHDWNTRSPSLSQEGDVEKRIQDIMWLVFEYGDIRDGIDKWVGKDRDDRIARLHEQDDKIRKAIRALQSQPVEGDKVAIPKEPDDGTLTAMWSAYQSAYESPMSSVYRAIISIWGGK